MSRNIGRQAYRAEQNTTHRTLDSDIADTRSLLNASAETVKGLKVQLKELTDKKKDAGKAPRNSQMTSNKFNVPIPKIQGTTSSSGALNASCATTIIPSTHDNLNLSESPPPFQPPIPLPVAGDASDVPTGVLGLPLEVLETPQAYTASGSSEELNYHPGYELPPFDLDLFMLTLENEPVAEPTAEEIAAYHFLKFSLGK